MFLKMQEISKRQAMALGNRAAALDVLKEFEAAMKAYQDAAELFKSNRRTGIIFIYDAGFICLTTKDWKPIRCTGDDASWYQ